MPLLIHAALSWLVGAFAGSSPSLEPLALPSLVAGGVMGGLLFGWVAAGDVPLARRPFVMMGIASFVVAGSLGARASVSRNRACRHALAEAIIRGDSVRVAFDDRVAPRSASRGIATGSKRLVACRVPVSGRIASGFAAPGRWVSFRGRAIETDRGLRVEGSVSALSGAGRDWARTLRGRAGERIDRDFGRNGPLVRALLIADQDGIAPSVRDTFADAGLVHMLSISGLHVAIIAGALLTMLGAMRLSRAIAYAAAMVVIVGYVAVLGAPPPAVRSAVMLGVVGLSQRLQRPTHPWTALALGAVIPTIEPATVLDLGWQLSVSGMAALVAARAFLRRIRLADAPRAPGWKRRALASYQRLNGWRYTLLRELVTGVIATIVTAPLIAWTFGRVSLVAPLSNIAAGPVMALVQPALFLAVVASPWPAGAKFIADAAAMPLALLERIANGAAAIPHASLHLAPTATGAVCAGVAVAALVRATASRHWVPGFAVAVCAMTIAVWLPVFSHGTGRMEMHVLDVGQGDALAIRTPRGRWILVDAGRRWEGGDAGRRTVVPYVRRFGGDVAVFVLSHAHDDHAGGAASVVSALAPSRWWEPAFISTSTTYRRTLQTLREKNIGWHRVRPGDRWRLDGLEMRVLAPDSVWTASQKDINETSVVLRIAFGQVAFLLMGDAEGAEERWLVDNTDPQLLRADVLKVGHHGSKTSSTFPLVEAVRPRLGVISVGAGNHYGHPSPETLELFGSLGIPLLRTDREGTFVVETDGRAVVVRVGHERWRVPDVPE